MTKDAPKVPLRCHRVGFIQSAVHRKLPLVLMLTAWLFATGSQWDLVQTFAWARMFANNAKTLPMDAALARTFSPEGRCDICHTVSAAKQQQDETDQSAGGQSTGKTVLLYAPAPVVVIARPDIARFSQIEISYLGLGRMAPPLPPPRV